MEEASEILNWYLLSGVEEFCADTTQNFVNSENTKMAQTQNSAPNSPTMRPATTLLDRKSVV